ncbi:MAG: tetratricopeptide repeat protein [Myxococcales bacterium]|nr:tetratricopeptide repeat protein [Myxococcales bacterium]HIK84467.1 tetratricopeptide repeat protein [Myxococcales bacterium]
MPVSPGNRRILALIVFVGLCILAGFAEKRVLIPFAESRSPADEVMYWARHVERNPETAASHLRAGLAYANAGQLEEANDAFSQALILDPSYDAAAVGRYGVDVQKGGRDRALAKLDRYARDNPGCGVCWQNLAAEYLRLQKLRAAQSAVQHLLASDLSLDAGMYSVENMEVEALVLAGRVYAARGDRPRAIGYFRDAIEREPGDLRAYILQAKNLLAKQEPGRALIVLDAAEAHASESPRIQREIERLRRRANQVQK